MIRRRAAGAMFILLLGNLLTSTARAQGIGDMVPLNAANCATSAPPASAGIAATPGGFVMIHPRNDAITDGYTGCKLLWVVDGDRMMRLATLYFDAGVLSRAISHDVRDPRGGIEVACDLKTGRSLLPNAGRRAGDAACRSVPRDELYALRVATWPRSCLKDPDAAPCRQDPPGSGSAAGHIRTPSAAAMDSLLEHLVGAWRMTGTVRGRRVSYRMDAARVLQHRFVEMHLEDVARPAAYESRVFIGVDSAASRYLVHWLDSFGAANSVPHGVGGARGDTVHVDFAYADGPFRDTFAYDRRHDARHFLLESGDGAGGWKTSAEYRVERR